jgi:tetratricopeptide (TPR) repeat protein
LGRDLTEWVYDPRREARRQLARVPLPDDVDPRDLDQETRRQLQSLAKETAEIVAKHLIVAGRLMDTEPQQALAHARAARALAGRIGAAREANGLVAYVAGEWSEALSELRAARRMTGQPDHLAVMADCERALGRPDRALIMTEDPQAKALEPGSRVELMIVASGARRDLGQPDAAVALLQVPALEGPVREWTARLRYAYADALLDAGRPEDARQWFARAAEVDEQGDTDAEDRVMELDGLVFQDLEQDEEHGDEEPREAPLAATALADLVRGLVSVEPEQVSDPGPEPVVEPVASELSTVEPAARPAGPTGQSLWRAPVAQDEEIPALGRLGSTALGFVSAPNTVPDPSAGSEASGPGGQEPLGDSGDLRLFD